jgi:hypothetical protein
MPLFRVVLTGLELTLYYPIRKLDMALDRSRAYKLQCHSPNGSEVDLLSGRMHTGLNLVMQLGWCSLPFSVFQGHISPANYRRYNIDARFINLL